MAGSGPTIRRLLAAGMAWLAATVCSPLAAAPLIGAYQALIRYDRNIFNEVQLASEVGSVVLTDGAAPGALNIELTYASRSLALTLSESEGVARLATPNVAVGNSTILDLILLSDGNNVVMGLLERVGAGASTAVSFALAQWQLAGGAPLTSPEGTWVVASAYGHLNIWEAVGPAFRPSEDFIDAFTVALDPPRISSGLGSIPVTQDGNWLVLSGAPYRTPDALNHAFDFMYDAAGFGSMFLVGSELNDPTDVSMHVALLRRVPEPSSAALALLAAGLLLQRGAVRKRSASSAR